MSTIPRFSDSEFKYERPMLDRTLPIKQESWNFKKAESVPQEIQDYISALLLDHLFNLVDKSRPPYYGYFNQSTYLRRI